MLRFPRRFSLRTAFVVFFLVAVICAILGNWWERQRRNEAAMFAISKKGGSTLSFDSGVQVVVFRNSPSCWTIYRLEDTKSMPRDGESDEFANADISLLKGLKQRLVIDLDGTRVDDDAVEAIARLRNLRMICNGGSNLSSTAQSRLRELRPDVEIVHQDWFNSEAARMFIMPPRESDLNAKS